MFGMGITELLIVAVIAIIFLGPEKLPTALMETAKFFKKIKGGLNEAKSTIDNELKIADLKEEALSYKKQLDEATASIDDFKNFDITKDLQESVDEVKDTVKDVEKSEHKLEKKIETIKKDENA
ncbi:MAG: Sec-independent protein translocase protein TatB [Campylobacterota bacterium]